jgi:hypothetical protein
MADKKTLKEAPASKTGNSQKKEAVSNKSATLKEKTKSLLKKLPN